MATRSKRSPDRWYRGRSLVPPGRKGHCHRLPGTAAPSGTGRLWAAARVARAVWEQQQSLRAAVKTMDRGEENAAREENGRSGTEEYLPELEKKAKENEYAIKSTQWITGNSFTVERGRQQIEECISTWDIPARWLHWSEFLREEELKYSKRYHYRVCWSVPTRRKPIPRATASVYFVIEISKIKPAALPVEVFFTLESGRLIHRPEQCQFREKWLKDIIENKIILMERLTFY